MIDHDNLEEFADPQTYDIEVNNDAGIAFYTALAQETGGPVLELACGTGRVAIPIAQQGLAVTGLDIVPGMLEQAQRKSAGMPTRWVAGDARDFDLGAQFRLVFITGNAFQAFLTHADQAALLRCVHTHLHDDGLFAFETRNPRWTTSMNKAEEAFDRAAEATPGRRPLFAFLETRADEEEWPGYIDAAGREVRVTRTQVYDHVNQILHWTTRRRWQAAGQEQSRTTRIALRYTFPQELATLLHYNGFEIIRHYGDWNYEPLRAESVSIIVVCRKRG